MSLINVKQTSLNQSETLSSLCNWWIGANNHSVPGVCQWFVNPDKSQLRSISNQLPTSSSDIENLNMRILDHTSHTSYMISLLMILGLLFFVLFIITFITYITRRKFTQPPGEDSLMSQRISSHMNLLHMRARSQGGRKNDVPPDYVSVIEMKKREDEELPTYSEAIINESGKSDCKDTKDKISDGDDLSNL